MNQRSLMLLGGATMVVAVLAALTLRHRESTVEETLGGAKLFPALTAAINDATSIEVKRKDGAYTLKKTGDTWGLAEKNGYPVDMGAVRKCLIELAQMTTAEEKTADPALYSKLGVEDPGTEGSTSALLTIRDANDKELATLIVGKEHSGKSAAGPHQVYVRKPGEARSWLANGQLELKEKNADWLDKKILEIKRERVRAVEVRHPGGEVVLIDRDKPETNDFTLHDIPEGKELSYPTAPSALGSALEWLNLEDVLPAAQMDVREGSAATTKFSCFDGLTVTVTTKNVDDKTYARFEASYEAPPEGAGPPAPEEAKAENGEAKNAEGDPAAEKPKKPEKKSREEVEKEAAALNARLSSWTFAIPAYNKASFQKQKSELLKDKAPPPAPPKTEGTSEPSEPKPGDPQAVTPEPPHVEKPADPDHEHDRKPPKFERL